MKENLKKFAEIFVGFDNSKQANDEVKKENDKSNETVSFPETKNVDSNNGFPTSSNIVNTSTSQTTSFNAQSSGVITSEQCEPHMGKIFDKYEQKFESLNMQGYDFFEFFKMVMQVDPNNRQAYDMALTMGKSMDSTLTKEKLIEQSNFYVSELNKVHTSFNDEGKNKITNIEREKQNELSLLQNDIDSLEKTIEEAKKRLEEKKNLASNIDDKYNPTLIEVKCKLQANDMAKDKLVNSISLVVNNLKQ